MLVKQFVSIRGGGVKVQRQGIEQGRGEGSTGQRGGRRRTGDQGAGAEVREEGRKKEVMRKGAEKHGKDKITGAPTLLPCLFPLSCWTCPSPQVYIQVQVQWQWQRQRTWNRQDSKH